MTRLGRTCGGFSLSRMTVFDAVGGHDGSLKL
jgi:hypothetical protein